MMRTLRGLASTLALFAFATGCHTTDSGTEFMHATPVQASSGQRPSAKTGDEIAQAPVADGVVRAEIGELAPDFELADLDGRVQRLSKYRGKIVVLEWFNPECPFVAYSYDSGPLHEMQARYATTGVVWLAINSSPPAQEGSDPASNRAFAAERNLRIPILLDPAGVIGRTYAARTTPTLYIVNERGLLVYSGGLDNAPMGQVESASVRTNYVDVAISDLRSGHAVTTSSTHPYGTPIKYTRP